MYRSLNAMSFHLSYIKHVSLCDVSAETEQRYGQRECFVNSKLAVAYRANSTFTFYRKNYTLVI